MKQYLIISDQQTLAEYRAYYFKKYPRRTVFPIETPIHPSMNKWIKLQAFKQDALKQAWGNYTEWLVAKYGFTNLKLDNCTCLVKIYRPSKRRYDLDNLSLKFCFDGIVKAGMLIDDDIEHMNPLTLWGGYDKNNPRMEIIIEVQGENENVV